MSNGYKIHMETSAMNSFFREIQSGLELYWKRDSIADFFHVDFVKFLKIAFLNAFDRLLLMLLQYSILVSLVNSFVPNACITNLSLKYFSLSFAMLQKQYTHFCNTAKIAMKTPKIIMKSQMRLSKVFLEPCQIIVI